MRICILSDVSAPTHPAYAGHGLGQAVYRMAEALKAAGHEVVLFAGKGSYFSGELHTPIESERDYRGEPFLAREAVRKHQEKPFEVFIDNSHVHVLSGLFSDLPVVNVYHDIFQPAARCPVTITSAQKSLMPPWAARAIPIPHVIPAEDYPFAPEAEHPPYALFLGLVRDYKQPLLAIEACALAGIKLKMVGPTPPGVAQVFSQGTNVEYLGPLQGEAKVRVIQGATVYLQLGLYESFGLTTIEAGLCGVPVVAWPSGGACELVQHGVSGAFVPGAANRARAVADTITRARTIERCTCREWAERYTDFSAWLFTWEAVLKRCVRGEWW